MARWVARQRWLIVTVCAALLMSGTPAAIGQVSAREHAMRTAQAAQAAERAGSAHASIGVPPDTDAFARSLPTASGANPPYPLNHTFDADPHAVGTPPTNADVETAGTTTGTPPTNHDLETAPVAAGSPTNFDFASGDLSGWTTSGTVSAATDTPHGTYASLGTGGVITSDAFTVGSEAQAIVVEIGFLTTSGYTQGTVYVLSGADFATSTSIMALSCNACNRWETRTADATPYRGQTIKLKVSRSSGTLGVDAARAEVLAPGYTLTGSGKFGRVVDGGNAYLRLDSGGGLTTSAFSVAADAQVGGLQVSGLGAGNDNVGLYVLSGPTFGTSTLVVSNSNVPDGWSALRANLVAWRGQTIKLKVTVFAGTIGADDVGVQRIELVGWEVEAGTSVSVLGGGPTGNYVSTTGDLTTAGAITLPADVQQLTVDYKSAQNSTFYLELLTGPTYSTVVDLAGATAGDAGAWKTLTVSVQAYAGQSVKLRVRQFFGTGLYDNIGLLASVLPGWTLTTTTAVLTGEDANGSYITAAGTSGAALLRSVDLSTGMLDRYTYADQRFYSITYDIGYATGSLVQVSWVNTTGQSWVVFSDAANSPTGPRTRYFWLADFMVDDPAVAGSDTLLDGYLQVQVPSSGKLYQVADNIARQQLNEPFSEQVGQGIDTTTGAYGYQQQDLATAGTMPLSFTRYYNGHADRYGPLGARWSHTYETRLVITDDGDVGVIFGSGKEVFFDEQGGLYTAVDARIHDTLWGNFDGTYDYTTTANLTYHFSATGRLESISDLNDSVTALSYDGNGRLVTVTAPGSQTLTLAYDANGRLASVTDPVGALVTYSYDANGDLTSVTDPESKVRAYTYSRHRLTSVTDPNGRTLFTNTLDSVNRVITQTDPAGETLSVAYSTPSKGVTSVTDPLNRTATFYFDRYGRTTDKMDPNGRVISSVFDATGNLDTVIDRSGEAWDFAYNTSGDLTGSADPLGNPTTITWNSQHLPASVTDARGNTTTYTYDADGNVLTMTNALNQTTTYTYDAAGHVLTETNALNQTTTCTYDSQGHRLTKTDPLNRTWTWTYDAAGRVLTETNPLNQTTTYTYNLRGDIKTITDPLGNLTEFTWDPYGNLWVQEDALNNDTTWVYDSRALITERIDKAGKITTYTYDDAGNMTAMTDPLGHTTSWTFDSLSRVSSETTPTNGTTTFTYDAEGRLASETDPLGRTISYGYDAAGRLTSKTLPNGGVWTYTYDANGNLLTETDPMSRTTTYTYDALNRVNTKRDALNNTTMYSYDAAGRLASVTDPLDHTTSYTYDAAGQLTTMTDALGGTVTFSYDAAGRRTGVTNPRGQTWTYTYDANGKVLSETDPLGRVHTFSYDAIGQLISETDARNVTVGYSYDPRGLRTAVTYPGGSISLAYDDAGRRTSLTDATGTTTWGYDNANRVTSVAAPAGTVSYTYNGAGQRATMVLPGNRAASYGYNAAGLLESLTDWQGRTIGFSYNLAEQRTSLTRPNGVTTTYGYDAAGRLNALTHTNGGVTLQSFSYTLDAAGNRTSVTTPAGVESYTYDALNRLTQVLYPTGDTVGYTYDAQGNRLTQTVNGVQTATYTYDNADQLTSDGTRSYTYDAAGNMLTAGMDSYSWDWANRLTSATVNGTTTSFTYDGDNVRSSLTTGGVTTSYVWDRSGASVPLMVHDGTKSYLHADGLLAEIDAANAATYPLADALGSVRGMTDGAGALVGTRDYDVFGATRASTGVGSTFGYTGEQSDASTGLTYLRARYLNPSLGRFLSSDTVQPNGPGTQGYNRCAYTANNPATWTDPTGHLPLPSRNACEDLVTRGISLIGGAIGALIGKHHRAAYFIGIVAFYNAVVMPILDASVLFPSLPDWAKGGIWAIWGGGLLWGELRLAFYFAGDREHMSFPSAFAILLAGVLFLLGAAMLEQLALGLDWYLGIPGLVCDRLNIHDLPTAKNLSYLNGSNAAAVQDATPTLPHLPNVSPPQPSGGVGPIPI